MRSAGVPSAECGRGTGARLQRGRPAERCSWRMEPRNGDRFTKLAYIAIALLAATMSAAGIFNDFVYDDVPIIRDNIRGHSLAHWADIVSRPYWPPPFVEQLYRPLASSAFAVEYMLGHGSPVAFRLTSCVLYPI